MTEEKYNFIIDENYRGTRIDLVLSLLLPETSRSYIQKLIEQGMVKVDEQICNSKKHKLEVGCQVEVTLPAPQKLTVEAENIPLDLVYEDEYVLIARKSVV